MDMKARSLFPLACCALVTLSPLQAEIHVDDPAMLAALEEYAEFAASPPEESPSGEAASPFVMAITKFFGLNEEGSPSESPDN